MGNFEAQYESANLKIDKDRVLTYSNIACPLDCKYCFANEIIRYLREVNNAEH
jgi:sulfatase maturation enzyme AslB (radical SAM superfamily)